MLRANQRRCCPRSRLVQAITFLLLTAGIALAGQPAKDNARDCIAATLHRFGAGCAVADLDADHQADVALSLDLRDRGSLPGSIAIHLSQGQPEQHLALPLRRSILGFSVRDVDGDGDLDIALTGGMNETRGVFLNDGSGQFKFDESDSYLTEPNCDYSRLAPPSKDNREVWSLADGGTQFSLIPTRCFRSLDRSTALLRLESPAASFFYQTSPVRIRAP